METYFVIPTRAVNGPRGRLPFPTGHIKAADGGATGGQCPDGEVRPGQASFSLEWACAPPLGWWSCSRGRHSLKPSPSPPPPPKTCPAKLQHKATPHVRPETAG